VKHSESKRIVEGAEKAVLFIHGICGSANHFRQLLPLEQRIPETWSYHNLVLDGHCKSVEDFGHTSMAKWKAQTEAAFLDLCRCHREVILVGHSMGTLLSIGIALKFPQKVGKLFLLAVPVKVFVQPRAIPNLVKIAFDKVDATDPVLVSMQNACGIRQTKKIWKYIPWIPRMVELLRLCGQTATQLGDLRVPCIAIQSAKDEMVSGKAGILLRKSGRVAVVDLPNSTHFYYEPRDRQTTISQFEEICKE
jgi:carboxylesterase